MQFGFEMGTGARTYVPTSAPYILALAIFLLGPAIGTAIVAGIGFGIGRSAVLMGWFVRSAQSESDQLLARRNWFLVRSSAALVCVAIALLLWM
jgi:hypothetical protein